MVLTGFTQANAQAQDERTVEIAGQTLRFQIRAIPADVQRREAAANLRPTNPLNSASLLNHYLSAGRIEDAALLSNAPRRRFEVLRDYEAAVGKEAFKKVYAEYFQPENRLVAQIVIDKHSLLIWHFAKNNRYAGQYYVQVEDKVLLDDAPGETRARLRLLLEAVRRGEIAIPPG
jgi:hypothetical protein